MHRSGHRFGGNFIRQSAPEHPGFHLSSPIAAMDASHGNRAAIIPAVVSPTDDRAGNGEKFDVAER